MDKHVLDGIEALGALEQFGTISEAATRLRLTQSAVSKRLKALQEALGAPLVEPDGRRVRLTAAGFDLLARARPLLGALNELATPRSAGSTTFSLAIADSIAASWGPMVVAEALAALDGAVAVQLHAHRTVLLLESVRLGRYQLGLATETLTTPDLFFHPVLDEPMVLVRCGRADAPLLTIEATSATWTAIEAPLRRRHPELLARALTRVESFGAALQMVKAGFGDGLIPLGLVREARLPPDTWTRLAVSRRVSLVTRKTVGSLARFERFSEAIRRAAARFGD